VKSIYLIIYSIVFVFSFIFLHASEKINTDIIPSKICSERLHDVKRIVFLGDSITQSGDYVVDFECWLIANGFNIEVLNLGLSSETATYLTPDENLQHLKKYGFPRPFIGERLNRVLKATKPDMVIMCYGMNDAGSLPQSDIGTNRFSDAITRIRNDCLNFGVKYVIICTPPVHDSKDNLKLRFQDENIQRFTDWLIQTRSYNWNIVDIHTPMKKALIDNRLVKPSFNFAKDGVHPDRNGHWIMAHEIIVQGFGAKMKDVSSSEDLFTSNGSKIRKLIHDRSILMFNFWMAKIGHTRPGVQGGPSVKITTTLSILSDKLTDINSSLKDYLKLQ
jgi:hypothetical protein